jgi:hypothetical protein
VNISPHVEVQIAPPENTFTTSISATPFPYFRKLTAQKF